MMIILHQFGIVRIKLLIFAILLMIELAFMIIAFRFLSQLLAAAMGGILIIIREKIFQFL